MTCYVSAMPERPLAALSKRLLPLTVVALTACSASEDGDDAGAELLARLNAIEGIRAARIEASTSLAYDLRIRQPVDHDAPDGATFEQRAILRFAGRYDGPLVLITDGYQIQYLDEREGKVFLAEPTQMLGATQLEVEHRFFASSIPDPPDWSKLDIAQTAADHHRVHDLLAPLFTGAWVSTGVSQSGSAALYYRSLYPDDVTATVAYVAPVILGLEDPRFAARLRELGDAACRDALVAFQREALSTAPRTGPVTASRRSDMVRRMRNLYGAENLTLLTPEVAYETAIIDTPFLFWQYLDPSLCVSIPDAADSDAVFFDFFRRIFDLEFLTNAKLTGNRPYRYQLLTELGTYALDLTAIADLLLYDADAGGGAELPATVIPAFDPVPMQRVTAWAGAESERVLLVYGANDPWSAGAVQVSGASRSFTAPNANHAAAIRDLGAGDREAAEGLLGEWTGGVIDLGYR